MDNYRLNLRWILSVALAGWALLSARADDFDSGGVRIHYVMKGQGDPVVLIHGLDSSAAMNWGVEGTIALLARNYQVVALDCRGHGQSGKPSAEGSYGTNMVEDVVRLMNHLHIAKAQVVGYSMGGMIAMKLAVNHPDRVSALVLGGMGWHQASAPMNRFWESLDTQGRGSVPPACMHEFPALAVSETEIKNVRIPVSLIVGDRDPTRRMYVEPLEKVRPDWSVQIVSGAGHLNCVAKPEFKKDLNDALAR
jgi:pimeloyl-ACP methyl ester carboxylesterase